MSDHQVIIVGGGPVGLTLAIDLGQRGVDCLLLDKRPAPAFLPKMERSNARTMEHFRHLGIAQQVRDAGYPRDLPLDTFLVTSLVEPPLMRVAHPSVREMQKAGGPNDGRTPLEPYQIVSQYTLEPLLKSIAEGTPGVTVRFGCEVLSFAESEDEVAINLRELDGSESSLTCRYLVGCDGGASTVRQGLGIELEGESNLGELTQTLFYCEDLFERIPIGKGAHYHVADDRWSFLIVQDDLRHFTLHARVDDPSEMPCIFERVAGMPIRYETVFTGQWRMRLMLAGAYSSVRVFLAGDSAHLVPPIGGLGMNTGIGDAINLAWKLAGAIQGWGGPELLRSYATERRLIGARNIRAANRTYEARRLWRDLCQEDLGGDGPVAPETLEHLGRVAYEQEKRGPGLSGITLGYRYLGSNVISYEDGDHAEDQDSYEYVPTARPGARAPHVWLKDGSAVQDHISAGYTLLRCGGSEADTRPLRDAYRQISCPLGVLDVSDSPQVREIYETDYVLLRPDLHVAWRGDEPPKDPVGLAQLVTGQANSARP